MKKAGLFAVCLALGPALAMAQEPAPASIVPITPAVEAPASSEAKTPSKPSRLPTGVSETALEAPSIDFLGVSHADYGIETWKGSKLANIVSWGNALRLDTPSPAMHAIALNLLSAPSAPDDVTPPGTWLSLRLQGLMMLGEEKAVNDIASMTPQDQHELAERVLTEQEILKGNNDKACERIAANVTAYNNSYWARANLLCLATAKKDEELDLALKVLNEQGEHADMEDALRKIAGDSSVKLPTVKSLMATPVDAATMIGAGMVLDNTMDTSSSQVTPALARFYAEQGKWPLKSRTTLAERAFRAGALPADALLSFYKQFSFKQAQVDAFLKQKQLPEGKIEARALVLQLLDKETNPEAARDIIVSALPAFKKMNQQDLFYRAAAPKVKSFAIPAKLEGAWKDFAPYAVVMLAAANEDQAALGWWQALGLVSDKTEAYENVRPLASVLFPDAALSAAQMEAWLAKAPKPYAQSVVAVYTGLGIKVNPALYASWELKDNAPYMSFALSQLMIDAANARRKGDAALLGLVALSEKGTNVSDMTLFKIIKEWQAAGLGADAKALAREALINRLP